MIQHAHRRLLAALAVATVAVGTLAVPAGAAVTVPSAPLNVEAFVGDTYATVSFTAPTSDGGATIESYTVTASPGGATCSPASAAVTDCLVDGLTNGDEYTFTVVATNAIGPSVSSATSNPVEPSAWGDGTDFDDGGAFYPLALSCPQGNRCVTGGFIDSDTSALSTNGNPQAGAMISTDASTTYNLVNGIKSLDVGGGGNSPQSSLTSVACADVSFCIAGGSYVNSTGVTEALVAEDVSGTWYTSAVPGVAALNAGGASSNYGAETTGVACLSGNSLTCYFVGTYTDSAGDTLPWVDSTATDGNVNKAVEAPGASKLNIGGGNGDVEVPALSCPRTTSGTCVLGGFYADDNDAYQAMIGTVSGTTFSSLAELPGSAALNVGANDSNFGAQVSTSSCASATVCTVGGYYSLAGGGLAAFVSTRSSSTWTTVAVPGAVALNQSTQEDLGSEVDQLSCPAVGDCTLTGDYQNAKGQVEVMVDSELAGSWGTATSLPNQTNLPGETAVYPNSLSCQSAGNCTVVGEFTYPTDSSSAPGAYFATETDGTWSDAGIPATFEALGPGEPSSLNAVSCSADGSCTMAGVVSTGSGATYNFFGVLLTLSAPPGPPATINTTPVGKGEVKMTGQAGDDGGSQVTSMTVTVEPGGEQCELTPATSCTITGLNPFTDYTASGTETTNVGTSTATVGYGDGFYADGGKGFTAVLEEPVASKDHPVSVLVFGGRVEATTVATLSNGSSGVCTGNYYGECVLHVTPTKVGRGIVVAKQTSYVAPAVALSVVSFTLPATGKVGQVLHEVIADAPAKTAISISLSDGRVLTAKSSAAGTASVAIPLLKKGSLVAATSVDGVALAPALRVVVS